MGKFVWKDDIVVDFGDGVTFKVSNDMLQSVCVRGGKAAIAAAGHSRNALYCDADMYSICASGLK